jgi:hypothetical protein
VLPATLVELYLTEIARDLAHETERARAVARACACAWR